MSEVPLQRRILCYNMAGKFKFAEKPAENSR